LGGDVSGERMLVRRGCKYGMLVGRRSKLGEDLSLKGMWDGRGSKSGGDVSWERI
jgi:hypothetical protein